MLAMAKHLDKIEGMERNFELAELTTFKMGGPADYFYRLRSASALPAVVEAARADFVPYLVLGGGSNLIFSEIGFRGLIVYLDSREIAMDGELLMADAGAQMARVMQFAASQGLVGLEKFMGLPGTIGGAVRGNAGAFGVEIKDSFEKALIFSEEDGLREVGTDYLDFKYRHSRLKETGEIVLKVWLRLAAGDSDKAMGEMRDVITSRSGKQPWGKSAGSFFKNPSGNSIGEGLSAGYMNDQCGFKGYKVGGAYISEKHANFLMNDGSATMADVLALCTEIQDAVEAKFGVRLEREVQLFGPDGRIEN